MFQDTQPRPEENNKPFLDLSPIAYSLENS
jgi:hypothetical protein